MPRFAAAVLVNTRIGGRRLPLILALYELRDKKIMSRKSLFFCVFLIIVSCASNTGVIQIGEGKLFISKQAATGFPGTGGIKTESIMEASKYCKSRNKSLKIVELKENEGPYVLGKYPRVELTFICE